MQKKSHCNHVFRCQAVEHIPCNYKGFIFTTVKVKDKSSQSFAAYYARYGNLKNVFWCLPPHLLLLQKYEVPNLFYIGSHLCVCLLRQACSLGSIPAIGVYIHTVFSPSWRKGVEKIVKALANRKSRQQLIYQ